jgi:hypothetical protein
VDASPSSTTRSRARSRRPCTIDKDELSHVITERLGALLGDEFGLTFPEL